jgi:LEA14-like dessication related protein
MVAARPWVTLGLLLALAGCATVDPGYGEPAVTLQSFRMLPAEGMSPRFEVGLNILNPNGTELDLAGVVYTISVQGHDLVKGAGKDFPVVEAYSEEAITLQASANLLGGIQLFADIARDNPDRLEYRFDARLDLKGIYPSIKVSETGTFNTSPRPRSGS